MTDPSDEIIALSDEYVLGLLSGTEATLMEEVMARDAELSRRVGALRDHLLPLDQSATPQDLPDGFARDLRARLPAQDRPLVSGTAPPPPANLSSAPRKWGLGVVAASLVGLAVGFGGAGLRPLPQPTVVAVLLDDAGVPQAVIDDYGNDTATVRFVADIDVPADRTLQVWTLPSEQMGPTSLGTLDRIGAARLNFQDLPFPSAQQLYEVTLEPLGGSPTGRPTGPIIGKGFAAPQV
ncbi:anti-sigma factor [Pseudooceanicola algae]|uniref:Anti-sigma K factor RskA C-terminal domain-containing protein n=1 Tax=Pseudooceanicola algae TaxID=1537215 RepID=A0A418SL66_9RHOB|nr:anti-sigma factor [Pseudooceanicola algae]QPM90892.1 hypothetical protein PSAL_021340 [Pseudooceanicola algae]